MPSQLSNLIDIMFEDVKNAKAVRSSVINQITSSFKIDGEAILFSESSSFGALDIQNINSFRRVPSGTGMLFSGHIVTKNSIAQIEHLGVGYWKLTDQGGLTEAIECFEVIPSGSIPNTPVLIGNVS